MAARHPSFSICSLSGYFFDVSCLVFSAAVSSVLSSCLSCFALVYVALLAFATSVVAPPSSVSCLHRLLDSLPAAWCMSFEWTYPVRMPGASGASCNGSVLLHMFCPDSDTATLIVPLNRLRLVICPDGTFVLPDCAGCTPVDGPCDACPTSTFCVTDPEIQCIDCTCGFCDSSGGSCCT